MSNVGDAADLLSEATSHHRAGRATEARSIYQRILADQPDRLDVLESLAQLEFASGDYRTAEKVLRQALCLSPNSAHLSANLANALAAQRQFDEAIALYRRVLALTPDSPPVLLNFAAALRNHGSLNESAETYRKAIALLPNNADVEFKLSLVLREKGDLRAAIESLKRAVVLRSDFAEAREQLGFCLCQAGVELMKQGRRQEAIQTFEEAVRAHPFANCGLGNGLLEDGRLDEAAQAFRRALESRPDFVEAMNGLGLVYQVSGYISKATALYKEAWGRGLSVAGENLLVLLHLDPQSDPKSIYDEHARWNQRHTAALASEAGGHANDRSPHRRLRIGLVSGFFDEHPVGRFLLPLLAKHDRTQFEIICYSDVRRCDGTTETLRSLANCWRETLNLSDEQLAQLIRSDQIDILIDLGMHTRGNRMNTFARKPAPVQASYLAYCSTTGLETIDYRLSDPYLDPDDSDQPYYSEKTVRLRSYWCYSAPPPYPAHRQQKTNESPPAEELDQFTFGCLNDFSKVSDLSLSMWVQILRLLPDSRLLLHALEGSHRDRVTRIFAEGGVGPARVEFIGRLQIGDYFRQYHRIDIALDPTPWPGGTTTCDALWMGVPVVSMTGKTAVSRGGLSILSHVGHPELVAHDSEQYAQIARSLAQDRQRLAELRGGLRQTMLRSTLMDAVGFTRDFESCLRAMWREYIKAS